MKHTSLRRRTSFLTLSKAELRYSGRFAIFLFSSQLLEPTTHASLCQYGLTASRKIGNAVARNLGKRRVRALLFPFLKTLTCDQGFSLVIIVKKNMLTGSFPLAKAEMESVIKGFLGKRKGQMPLNYSTTPNLMRYP